MSMSSKPKRNGSIEFQVTSVHVAAEEASTRIAARDEEPRRRAYEIYLERGEQPGGELDDWLQARTRTRTSVAFACACGLGSRSTTPVDPCREVTNGHRAISLAGDCGGVLQFTMNESDFLFGELSCYDQ